MPKGKDSYASSDFMGALFNLVAAAKGGWAGGGKSKGGRSKGRGKGAEGKGLGDKGKGQGKSGNLHDNKFDPEWPCPMCGPGDGTRNRQSRTHCRACGAPRPKDREQEKGGSPGPRKSAPVAARPMGIDGRRPVLGCRDSSWRGGAAAAAEPRVQRGPPPKREAEPQRREPTGRSIATATGLRHSVSYAAAATRAITAGKGGARGEDGRATDEDKGYTVVDYGKGARPRVGRFAPLAEDDDDDPQSASQDETGDTVYHNLDDQAEQQQHQQQHPLDDADQQWGEDYDEDEGQADGDDAEDEGAQDAVEQAKEELEHRREIHRCIRASKGRNHPATVRALGDVQKAEKWLAEVRGPRKWWIQVRRGERRLEIIARAEDKLDEDWWKEEELFEQQCHDHQERQQSMQEKFDSYRAEKAEIHARIAAIKKQPLDSQLDDDDHEQSNQECAEAKRKVQLMGKRIAGILDMVEGNHKVHQELSSINMDLADLENLVGGGEPCDDEAEPWEDEEMADADGQRPPGGSSGKGRWSGAARSARAQPEAPGKGAAQPKPLEETRPRGPRASGQTTGARRPADSDAQDARGAKQAKSGEQRAADDAMGQGSPGEAATGAPSLAAVAAQRAAETAAAQAAEAAQEARRQKAMDALRAKLLSQQQKVLESKQQAANISASQAHARTEQQLEEFARQIEALNQEVAAQAEREWEAMSPEEKEELLAPYV